MRRRYAQTDKSSTLQAVGGAHTGRELLSVTPSAVSDAVSGAVQSALAKQMEQV